jgi:hypothetical protein
MISPQMAFSVGSAPPKHIIDEIYRAILDMLNALTPLHYIVYLSISLYMLR